MEDLISVIVPVYNAESFIKQCVDSILNQTITNYEIILVDDGSTDESGRILDEYQQWDKHVKVVYQKNMGLVHARKAGLKAATGNLIAYVDSDDWIAPNMLERLYDTMQNENVDIVMCGRYEDTGNVSREVYHGIEPGRYDKKDLIEKVYPRMIVNGAFFEWGLFPGVWDKLFKRELLESFQMVVDERLTMGEDAACTFPCILNADSIYILQECLYHYRQTPSSMVKKYIDKALERERFRILYKSVEASFKKYKDIYDLRSQWLEYILFLMVPRAEYLYEGVEELEYLFPYPQVKRGNNIIIYGMGTFGQLLYRYLKRTGFCNIAVAADQNYMELCKQGLSVISPECIGKYEYDAIVIANSFAKTRMAIYRELISRFPEEKVHMMDEVLVKNEDTISAFGLD